MVSACDNGGVHLASYLTNNKGNKMTKEPDKLRNLTSEELKEVRGGSTPPGQKGYEGQPGNQGNNGSNGTGGYEGQPGNQSNN